MFRYFKVLLLSTLLLSHFSLKSQEDKRKTEWLIVYYMPYDNDLSPLGHHIIKEIQQAISSDNVIATVQADFADSMGMKRFIISDKQFEQFDLKNEKSASIHAFESYLKWAINRIDYEKIALVFLNHGGHLDEICLDLNPEPSYLEIKPLNKVISEVLDSEKLDLLFFQLCSKSSIEALFTFKNASYFSLASQIELGAPNDYYEGLFTALSENKIIDGKAAAQSILSSEDDQMYNSYTLIDNLKLDRTALLIKEFGKELKKLNNLAIDTTVLSHYYLGEEYYDLLSFLKKMDLQGQIQIIKKRDFLVKFIEEELIVQHQVSPKNKLTYSGISFLYANEVRSYKHLRLYKYLKTFRKIK